MVKLVSGLGVMAGIMGATIHATGSGMGIPQPMKKPVSIREGSTKVTSNGRTYYRTRYFVGGGIHGGK